MEASGVVYKIFTREVRGKTFYSIKIDGDDKYYGTVTAKPPCDSGDCVTFQWKENSRGYPEADLKTLKVLDRPEVSDGSKAPRVDNRQLTISYQAAMNTASGLVRDMVVADVFTPTGKNKGEKFAAYVATVQELAKDLFLSYQRAPAEILEELEAAESGEPSSDEGTESAWDD